jgi:hypothetical protein
MVPWVTITKNVFTIKNGYNNITQWVEIDAALSFAGQTA